MQNSGFHTIKGYESAKGEQLTNAMEDYLEMICRHSLKYGFIRINQLSSKLNVKPPSATKMAALLKENGYIDYEKYGVIKPTKKGWDAGQYLLYRHDILHKFLCMINNTDDELEQVEKIEHFFDKNTVYNIEKFINRYKK